MSSVWSDADWRHWTELELWRHTGQTDTHWWSMQWLYEQHQARRELRKAREREQKAQGVDVEKAKVDRKRRREARQVKDVILKGGQKRSKSNAQSSTDVPDLQHDEQDNTDSDSLLKLTFI